MLCKKYLLVAVLPLFFLLLPAGNLFAQQGEEDIFALALDMYKFDQYLPAIDILEAIREKEEKNTDYWIYLGLAYQRTNQLKKAVEAYKKASDCNNKSASNLETRIINLEKSIARKEAYEIDNLSTPIEKANWLFKQAEAKRVDKSALEKSFRLFIQAVEYDVKYLSNDKDFVRSGSVYYRLKVKDQGKYSKLFFAIFTYFEGEIHEAFKLIKEFRAEKIEKSPAVLRMEEIYFKKISEASNEIKEFERAEREYAIYQKKEAEKAILEAKKIKSEKEKSPEKKIKIDIRDIESDINDNSFNYRDDMTFIKVYAQEMAKKKTSDYFATDDVKIKKQLIWEMGHTASQDSEVMRVICDGLKYDSIELVVSSLDAIKRIGLPSAQDAIPSLLELLDSERGDFRYLAAHSLGELGIKPEIVIPKIINKYSLEENEFLQKKYSECVNSFGKSGLNVAYKILENSPRIERLPIAKFINSITGEKVDSLMNR